MRLRDNSTGLETSLGAIMIWPLSRLKGTLSDEQWAEVRSRLGHDHQVEHHQSTTFYLNVEHGCPHGMAAALEVFDFNTDDPDVLVPDDDPHHFWSEEGDLYCKALRAMTPGCADCEVPECQLPEQRREIRADFWELVSSDHAERLVHEAEHKRRVPSKSWDCAYCKADAEHLEWLRTLDR
jgi:hypothetical protein